MAQVVTSGPVTRAYMRPAFTAVCALIGIVSLGEAQADGPRSRRWLGIGVALQESEVSVEWTRLLQAGLRRPMSTHATLVTAVEYARTIRFGGVDQCVSEDVFAGRPCLDPPEDESTLSASVGLRLHDVFTRGTRVYVGVGAKASLLLSRPVTYERRAYADPYFEFGLASGREGAAWELGFRYHGLSRFTLGDGGQVGVIWGFRW